MRILLTSKGASNIAPFPKQAGAGALFAGQDRCQTAKIKN